MSRNIKNHSSSAYHSGFSIIELSVVLSIIALIAATALSVGASRIEQSRVNTTVARMDFILKSLELYVARFGYLPCPADNNLPVANVNFGNGVGSANLAGAGCSVANSSATSPNTHTIRAGGIPVQHLGISSALAFDGWNRRFTYVVDQNLSFTDPVNLVGWADPTPILGDITITYDSGGAAITNEAVMVLISHGANGHGATNTNGSTILNKGCGASVDEDDNTALAGGSCPGFDASFVQRLRSNNYDDLVEYREKWQFEEPQ